MNMIGFYVSTWFMSKDKVFYVLLKKEAVQEYKVVRGVEVLLQTENRKEALTFFQTLYVLITGEPVRKTRKY